jgi:hypothetical protein
MGRVPLHRSDEVVPHKQSHFIRNLAHEKSYFQKF